MSKKRGMSAAEASKLIKQNEWKRNTRSLSREIGEGCARFWKKRGVKQPNSDWRAEIKAAKEAKHAREAKKKGTDL